MADIDKLSFLSDDPIDKVIGSFDAITTTYVASAASSLGGGFYSPSRNVYTIPNPAGQRGIPTMVYSVDGSPYRNQQYFLYSPGTVPYTRQAETVGMVADDTTVYFYFLNYNPNTVTFTMRWVLDYIDDGNRPPVEPVLTGNAPLQFTSNKNYMKRHPATTSFMMDGPNTFLPFKYVRNVSIPHDMGRPPFYRVAYEPFNDGKVFLATINSDTGLRDPINGTGTQIAPCLLAKSTASEVVLTMYYFDASLASNTYPVHCVIYKDYGLA